MAPSSWVFSGSAGAMSMPLRRRGRGSTILIDCGLPVLLPLLPRSLCSLRSQEIPLRRILGGAATQGCHQLRHGDGVWVAVYEIRSFRRAAAPPCCGVLSQSFGQGWFLVSLQPGTWPSEHARRGMGQDRA